MVTNREGRSLTAVIADDEPLARVHLRRLLESQDVSVIAEAENAFDTLQTCESLQPDVLFLDIQMPGSNGLAVATALLQLKQPPLLVFVTGYTEHAASAFEKDAVDYLLKPVSQERLLITLSRLNQRLAATRLVPAEPPRLLPARGEYAVVMLKTDEVVYAQAREKCVFLRSQSGSEHKSLHTLTQLDALLPANRFCRIHDSYVVNLDFVRELNFLGNHTYSVRLNDDRTLPVGRTRYAELRRRLGLP